MMRLLLLLVSLVAGQTYRYPIQYSGGAVSHADADGYKHVPRTLGRGPGSCLLTYGSAGDAYWGACPGASGGLDSAHVSALINDSLDANNHGWVTASGDVDSARVAGLSDSAKALVRYARTTAVHDTADTLRKSIATKPVKHRFSILSTTGLPPLTMSYDNSTRVLTLTPTGSSFSWWWYGIEHVQSTPLVLPAHSAATGLYFASLDSLGAVTISTTPFDLLRCVPIALFDRNSALGQTWVYPELHTDQITPLNHLARHTTVGTLMVHGGAAISGYTLNSDAPASVTYGIGSATLWDEDAKHTIAALADGGPYQVRYRTAPGVWSWASGLSVPYRVGTTYITADIAGVQTELNGAGVGQFVNYYVTLVPTLNGPQIVMIQGQAIHATEADAEAETWQSLDRTGLPYVEFFPVWQITYKAQTSYTGVTGRVRMVRAAPVGATSASGAAASSTLQSAYNASPTPQIVTSVAAGPLTVQRGTASDTNAVIQVQNGAGTVTARINGDGAYTGSAATLTTPRTLTIGSTGKTFNGSANVAWSLAEIGAMPSASGGTSALFLRGDGVWSNTLAGSGASLTVSNSTLSMDHGNDWVAYNVTAPSWGHALQTNGTNILTAMPAGVSVASLASGGMVKSSGTGLLQNASAGTDYVSPSGLTTALGSYLPLAGGTMTATAAVTFPGTYGGAILRDYTASASGNAYWAVYGSGITPSANNYGLIVKSNGTSAEINGTSSSKLSVAGTGIVTVESGGASVTGTITNNSYIYSSLNSSTVANFVGNTPAPSYWGVTGSNSTSDLIRFVKCSSTGVISGLNDIAAANATLTGLSAGGIIKASGAGLLGIASASSILAGISSDLWIGAPSGRGANSIGFGNSATGTGLWGWAFAQDADGANLINAPTGKTISLNIGGTQQGYVDYLGIHATAITSTDVNSTNANTTNLMVTSQDRRTWSLLTATNAASPGYGPDIMNITGPAHSLAAAASGSTYRQYRMPTAVGKSGVTIILSMGQTGSVNAPYLLAYSGEAIHEKDNGTVVGTDSSPYVRSGTIALMSDGAGWWVF